MFSAIESYFSQHRRKFIFSGLVLIGGIFVLARSKKNRLKFEKAAFKRRLKEQKHTAIQGVCHNLALNCMPLLKKAIFQKLSCNDLVTSLRNKKAVDKIAVWKEIQVLSCAKIITFIYATSMLFTFIKIQMNLFGGYSFIVSHGDSADEDETDKNEYFSLIQHFINFGVVELCEFIKEKVAIVMKDKSLQQEMSVRDVGNLFWAINMSILHDPESPCKNLGKYLLPDKYKDDTFKTESKFIKQLILDIKDLIEDINVTENIKTCLMEGSEFIIEEVKEIYIDLEKDSDKSEFCNRSSKKSKPKKKTKIHCLDEDCYMTIPMARIIPFIDNLIKENENDKAQKWMDKLTVLDNMNVMGANVFETFSSEW